MKFRELLFKLLIISLLLKDGWFDSRLVSAAIGIPVKTVSNDLRRLYFMGFLKRRRVKRACLSKKGKVCFKGYQYEYSLSKQGLSYINYMMNKERYDIESCTKAAVRGALRSYLEEFIGRISKGEEKDLLISMVDGIIGGNPRFSTLDKFVEKYIDFKRESMKRDERVIELKRKVEELKNEINRLNEILSRLNEIPFRRTQNKYKG